MDTAEQAADVMSERLKLISVVTKVGVTRCGN